VPLRPLVWDYRGRSLTLGRDRDFLVRRVLAEGGWSAIRALRKHVEDAAIRQILIDSDARGLSPARIRFWQLVLELPARRANAWVRAARHGSWEKRRQA
jgi:hypothetical protein